MRPVRDTCKPRTEVLKGDLQDAIFAADFGHVVAGVGPEVYRNPVQFFSNTHPAERLREVVRVIFGRLADPSDAGAAIRLSTGFGGGKTHTLIALWHLANNINNHSLGTELLPAAGRPPHVVVAGLDAGDYGAQVCGTHDGLRTRSVWGELAYQLGGIKGYEAVRDIDDPYMVPDSATIRSMLPAEPTLILMDELVIYMAILDDRAQGQLLAFLGSLISEISARHQIMLVITDPAGQAAYHAQAEKLIDATKVMQADKHLYEVLGRTMSNYEAIGREAAQVILRRLFEKVDASAASEASAEYYNAYQRVLQEQPDLLPQEAATREYAERIVQCYPFHPRLLDTAQGRLATMQDFNQSRGTLRLFARIVRDTWAPERGSQVSLICAGDLDWCSQRIQGDLLDRLDRGLFKNAVEADISGHAAQLDKQYTTDAHTRVASALLLESIPLNENATMDRRDITLAVLRPSEAGHEPSEALDRLLRVCWHTYRSESGARYQFRYEPNAIKIIEERMQDPELAKDAENTVLALVQAYFGGHTFQLRAYPSSPKAVTDTAQLKLVLADSEQLAQRVCDFTDDEDATAKMPRRFRNAILGVAPQPRALPQAAQAMLWQKAAEQVSKEAKRGSPLRAQVDGLLPDYRTNAQLSAIQAFTRVILPNRQPVTLAERYLVSKDAPLSQVGGQSRLMDFLVDNNLIYKAGDVLDVDLLMDKLLLSATPSLDYEGAYTAAAVHEAALAYRGLRLLRDEGPVRESLLKAVANGRLVVRQPDGVCYDDDGCVYGPELKRQRDPNRKLSTLKLSDDVFVALKSAPCVAVWLYIDTPIIDAKLMTVAQAAALKETSEETVLDAVLIGLVNDKAVDGVQMVVNDDIFQKWEPPVVIKKHRVVVYSWADAVQEAARRPLEGLRLIAQTPEAAGHLLSTAQPFGAQSLSLTVQVSGALKSGGTVNFTVSNVPHNSPLKPIDLASQIVRSATDTATFQAQLSLEVGDDSRANLAGKFQQAVKLAGSVEVEATFGPIDDGAGDGA